MTRLRNEPQIYRLRGGRSNHCTIALVTYPRLWEFLEVFILAFPTAYLVEKGFSAVVNLLQSNRNRLQIATKGDLRLFLSDIKPDFSALASRHQAQGSH